MQSKIDSIVWIQAAFWLLAIATVVLIAVGWWIPAVVTGIAAVASVLSSRAAVMHDRTNEAMEAARNEGDESPPSSK
jgi:CHASE2 domain-containing sensor protein